MAQAQQASDLDGDGDDQESGCVHRRMCLHLQYMVHTFSKRSRTFAMLRGRDEACLQRVVGVVQRPQFGLRRLLWPHEPQQQQRLGISPGDGETAPTTRAGRREVGGRVSAAAGECRGR